MEHSHTECLESAIQIIRIQEGDLFKSECVKSLYLNTKQLLVDSLTNLWTTFRSLTTAENRGVTQSSVVYSTALHTYSEWPTSLAQEETSNALKINHKFQKNLQDAVLIFARLLMSEETKKPMLLRPKLDSFLSSCFLNAARDDSIKSGEFFTMNPLQRDFVMREAFRKALQTVIEVVEVEVHPMEQEMETTIREIFPEKYAPECPCPPPACPCPPPACPCPPPECSPVDEIEEEIIHAVEIFAPTDVKPEEGVKPEAPAEVIVETVLPAAEVIVETVLPSVCDDVFPDDSASHIDASRPPTFGTYESPVKSKPPSVQSVQSRLSTMSKFAPPKSVVSVGSAVPVTKIVMNF